MRTSYHVMRIIAAAVPLGVLLGAAPSWADPTVYYHAGNWHAFTDKDGQGNAVCGIGTENGADGRNLTLTYIIGGSDLTLQANKPNWNIPDGTSLDASVQIDQNAPWPAQAAGNGTTVSWTLGAASIRSFDTQFRNGITMVVNFPSGNEPPWTIALVGSTAASATFWRCVQDLSDRAHITSPASNMPPPTQPYGQGPTQPYGQGQSPSQPYGSSGQGPSGQSQPPAGGMPTPTNQPPNGGPPPATNP